MKVWHAPGGSPWFLEHVTVEQPATGLEWQFLVNDWIEGGDRLTAKTYPAAGLSRENSVAVSGSQCVSFVYLCLQAFGSLPVLHV